MNKKAVFFILCNLNFIIIYASEKTITSLAISTLGNTVTNIFKQNDEQNISSSEFQNNASCCCCCCSFKSVTSWLFKTSEETSSNNPDLGIYHEQKPVKSSQGTEIK